MMVPSPLKQKSKAVEPDHGKLFQVVPPSTEILAGPPDRVRTAVPAMTLLPSGEHLACVQAAAPTDVSEVQVTPLSVDFQIKPLLLAPSSAAYMIEPEAETQT